MTIRRELLSFLLDVVHPGASRYHLTRVATYPGILINIPHRQNRGKFLRQVGEIPIGGPHFLS